MEKLKPGLRRPPWLPPQRAIEALCRRSACWLRHCAQVRSRLESARVDRERHGNAQQGNVDAREEGRHAAQASGQAARPESGKNRRWKSRKFARYRSVNENLSFVSALKGQALCCRGRQSRHAVDYVGGGNEYTWGKCLSHDVTVQLTHRFVTVRCFSPLASKSVSNISVRLKIALSKVNKF